MTNILDPNVLKIRLSVLERQLAENADATADQIRADMRHAQAFLSWVAQVLEFDADGEELEVRYFDGRTLVVYVSDSFGLTVLTYVFEETT